MPKRFLAVSVYCLGENTWSFYTQEPTFNPRVFRPWEFGGILIAHDKDEIKDKLRRLYPDFDLRFNPGRHQAKRTYQ